MPNEEEAKLQALAEQHGELVVAKSRVGLMAFKCPTKEAHERWVGKVSLDVDSKTAATREYVLDALVLPEREAAIGYFQKQPANVPKIAERLAKRAGGDATFDDLGDGLVAHTRCGDLKFRCPTLDEYERWIEKCAADKDSKLSATKEFVACCAVGLKAEDISAVFEKQPALPKVISDQLGKVAGNDVEFETKKA